jgi:peptidyl-tRNA hydrolase, PTH1 family
MRFVVGLGNPGERYRRTRHNIGWMVVDVLHHTRHTPGEAPAFREESGCSVATGVMGSEPVLFIKPLNYMNRSGGPLAALLSAHQGSPQDLVVIMDDVALDLGTLRIRERGSHGGHNGLRSIIDVLGSDEFPRIRVGVRQGELPEDLAEYVLSDFPEDQVLVVQEMVGQAAEVADVLVLEGAAAAMNRFNGPRRT